MSELLDMAPQHVNKVDIISSRFLALIAKYPVSPA